MTLPLGQIVRGDAREVLRRMPSGSVQCIVTSPPYWGLRDYSEPGQHGLEPTPEDHVAVMVGVFREARRVLRDDGVCWVNYGDCYASEPSWGRDKGSSTLGGRKQGDGPQNGAKRGLGGLKPKDLVGMPWRVAFALQADGWWLRADCIWAKPNPMPESVTDRPTKSHEYVFLLSKRARYFYDAEGVREEAVRPEQSPVAGWASGSSDHSAIGWNTAKSRDNFARQTKEAAVPGQSMKQHRAKRAPTHASGGRNLRTVWEIPTQPYPGAHFATFPEALAERCIRAGTSEKGACPACGAPWVRVVAESRVVEDRHLTPIKERKGYEAQSTAARLAAKRDAARAAGNGHDNPFAGARSLGWRPSCECSAAEPVPCVVLDPFAGSGTAGMVAYQLGREFVGIDLAGGDKDLGGHTAHDRLRAGKLGRPWREQAAHDAQGQGELIG